MIGASLLNQWKKNGEEKIVAEKQQE